MLLLYYMFLSFKFTLIQISIQSVNIFHLLACTFHNTILYVSENTGYLILLSWLKYLCDHIILQNLAYFSSVLSIHSKQSENFKQDYTRHTLHLCKLLNPFA